MNSCVFCNIIEGNIPSAKVYEDDHTLAFITTEAINPGHTLVIPKEHHRYYYDLDESLMAKVMEATRKVSIAINKTYNPKRVSLMTMGDEVSHVHIHIVPVNQSGDVTSKKLLEKTTINPEFDERQSWAKSISEKLVR